MRCLIYVHRKMREDPLGGVVIWWTQWNRWRWLRWPHLGYIDRHGHITHYGPEEYKECILPPLFGGQGPWRIYQGNYVTMCRLLKERREEGRET